MDLTEFKYQMRLFAFHFEPMPERKFISSLYQLSGVLLGENMAFWLFCYQLIQKMWLILYKLSSLDKSPWSDSRRPVAVTIQTYIMFTSKSARWRHKSNEKEWNSNCWIQVLIQEVFIGGMGNQKIWSFIISFGF